VNFWTIKKGLPIGKPLEMRIFYINYKTAPTPPLTCVAAA
jgi:hypothetical protein